MSDNDLLKAATSLRERPPSYFSHLSIRQS